MTDLVADPRVIWAIVLVVVIPLLLIGVGEVEERLRQRDSEVAGVVGIIRRWTIPLFSIWAVGRGLLDIEGSALVMRLAGTALVLSIAAASLRQVGIIVSGLRERSRDERGGVPALVLALPRVFLLLATFWVLFDSVWGVDLSSALTALGVTSLVVSFALQDTLSGLASGFLLVSDAPFQTGDWIQYGDLQGRVVDFNWRSSRIQNRNGDLVIVPNSQLAGATLINYDEPTRNHRVIVPIQVAFSNPPTVAKEMLLDAARSTPGVLSDPPPRARVVQVDDPLMGYEVELWIDDFAIAPQVESDFGSLVWYFSERQGVPLPSPAYDLYVYDGPDSLAASRPDRAEIRRRLRTSPLLDQLDIDDMGRLVASARPARFSSGEVVLDVRSPTQDLYVLWSGRAKLTLDLPRSGEVDAAEFGPGDVFGSLVRSERVVGNPRVVAVSDCEVVIVEESAAGSVASRNPELSEILTRLGDTRRRRIERMIEAGGSHDEDDLPPDVSTGGGS